MAGTIRGKVDCFSNTASVWSNAQECYKGLFDFFSASPRHTRLAWYRGDAAGNVPVGSGRGSDYWDGVNPMGRNAWMLIQFSYAQNPYCVLFQFQDGSSETVNGGGTFNGATSNGSTPSIGVQMVACKTAGGAPATGWNGTLLNTGLDTKSGAWWSAPAGGRCYAFPRANSTGGGYATNKNNLASVVSYSAAGAWRYHFFADDDNFAIVIGPGGLAYYYNAAAGGIYLPRTDLVSKIDMPLLMVTQTNTAPDGFSLLPNVFGPSAAGSSSNNGGIRCTDEAVGAGGGNDVVAVGFEELNYSPRQILSNPNKMFSPNLADGWPVNVTGWEATSAYGNLGSWDFLRHTYNVPSDEWNTTGDRAYFGGGSQTTMKLSTPWGGGFKPGTNSTRAGITF